MSPEKRYKVFVRDKFTCYYCGVRGAGDVELTLDHRIPRVQGGSDKYANVVTCCKHCNMLKSDLPEEIFLKIVAVAKKMFKRMVENKNEYGSNMDEHSKDSDHKGAYDETINGSSTR